MPNDDNEYLLGHLMGIWSTSCGQEGLWAYLTLLFRSFSNVQRASGWVLRSSLQSSTNYHFLHHPPNCSSAAKRTPGAARDNQQYGLKMHLRSGYVTPSDLGDWDLDPSDYESESDTHSKRHQQQQEQRDTIICAPTTVRNAGRHQTQSQAPASTDIPSWVPARLPSCVPGPRHDLPSGTQGVKSDIMIVKSNQNWPIVGSGFLQSSQIPGRLPVLGGRLGAVGDFNPMGIQNTFTGTHPFFPPIFGDGLQLNNKGFGDAFLASGTMGMANSLLPLMPLGAGRNPFLDFGIQSSLPFAGPSVNMDVSCNCSVFPSLSTNNHPPWHREHLLLPLYSSIIVGSST